jgi:hippurate hydrolase
MVRWRHHLHRFPETGFNEERAADYVASVLSLLGLEVHRGVGGTGIVANLKVGDGAGAIGLRADMDALAITEDGAWPGRGRDDG